MIKKILPVLLMLSLYLGAHNGYLALFQTGCHRPVAQYPIPIAMLPQTDQSLITAGIEIKNKLHLAQLLEDYLS